VPSQDTASVYILGDNPFFDIEARKSSKAPPQAKIFNLKVPSNHMPGLHWVSSGLWAVASGLWSLRSGAGVVAAFSLISATALSQALPGANHGSCDPNSNPSGVLFVSSGPRPQYTHMPLPLQYHPHLHGSTTLQVGTAHGMIIVEDDNGFWLTDPGCAQVGPQISRPIASAGVSGSARPLITPPSPPISCPPNHTGTGPCPITPTLQFRAVIEAAEEVLLDIQLFFFKTPTPKNVKPLPKYSKEVDNLNNGARQALRGALAWRQSFEFIAAVHSWGAAAGVGRQLGRRGRRGRRCPSIAHTWTASPAAVNGQQQQQKFHPGPSTLSSQSGNYQYYSSSSAPRNKYGTGANRATGPAVKANKGRGLNVLLVNGCGRVGAAGATGLGYRAPDLT
jgi:hypothetical protein